MTAVLPPVEMPQLSGGRQRAKALLEPLLDRMAGATVRVDCRGLVAGTASFADELVRTTLVDSKASLLVIEWAAGDFVDYLNRAAKDYDVAGSIRFV